LQVESHLVTVMQVGRERYASIDARSHNVHVARLVRQDHALRADNNTDPSWSFMPIPAKITRVHFKNRYGDGRGLYMYRLGMERH